MSTYTFPKNVFLSHDLRHNPDLFDAIITSVVVTGTPTNDGKTFHFCLSLVTSNESSAIRFDPTPSYTDPVHPMRTNLVLEWKKVSIDSNTRDTDLFKVPVLRNDTAGVLCMQLFNDFKVNQYDFDDQGRGCRHWCAAIFDILASLGITLPKTSLDFENWENKQYEKFGDMFHMPRSCGTFYTV
ncbi:hypothetical protein HHX47_DHR7000086 [Lentinula edodes]|nr:hypothetical protein HHX47_DHR7000086 [Lentinula edodes]